MVRPTLLFFCLCLPFFLLSESHAESIVSEGFKKWGSGGSAQAVSTWARQSRVLNDNKVSQITSELKKTETILGTCTGFDILETKNTGPKDVQIWAVAHFNYGSLFFRFLVFQDNIGQEYINGLWFSTDPLEVAPSSFKPLPSRTSGSSLGQ